MVKLSANIGFLWDDRPLPDRIEAAAAAGFRAVECHFPYEHPASDIASVLAETGLTMVGLNTGLGRHGQDDFGVAARPGRQSEAAELIEEAVEYGAAIGAGYVNVVAGRTGGGHEAEDVYRQNLTLACQRAADRDMTVVIEPLSTGAAPGYHLSRLEPALETIDAVDEPNLGVMLDCFHTQMMHGDIVGWLRRCLPVLGHVQISSVPDRAEPDHGELDYRFVLAELDAMGYQGYVGAEYRPATTVEAGLGWRDRVLSTNQEGRP